MLIQTLVEDSLQNDACHGIIKPISRRLIVTYIADTLGDKTKVML